MSDKLDITGMQFTELTAIRESPERLRNEIAWICECSCGELTVATRGELLRGHKKSCGCLRKQTPANALNLVDQRFGMLVARERIGRTMNDNALWLCDCDCGGQTKANATSLRRLETISCGCQAQTQAAHARSILERNKSVDGVRVPLLVRGVRSDSKTGHKGVYLRNRRGKEYYEVSLTVKGKRYYYGPFKDISEAIAARKRLEDKHHSPYIKALEEKENGRTSNQTVD